jgi:hypothetical protein
MAFLKVFVLAIFVSHIGLSSVALGIIPKIEAHAKAKSDNLITSDSKTPLSSSLPQQISLEELLILDDDNEENELSFSSSISSDFLLIGDYLGTIKIFANSGNSFFTSIPLYLLFKSWKAFLS